MKNHVITIARTYGSGGKQVGHQLADALKIACYDREVMRMASDASGISEELFAKNDETQKLSLLQKITAKVYNGKIVGPDSNDYTSTENLFNCQAAIIKELAEKESCVIIGRCGDYILKDNPNVIRLFLYASKKKSLENIKLVEGLEGKTAENAMEQHDRFRGEYYHYHTGKEWDDVNNYDLAINMDSLDFKQCVKMIQEYIAIRGGE